MILTQVNGDVLGELSLEVSVNQLISSGWICGCFWVCTEWLVISKLLLQESSKDGGSGSSKALKAHKATKEHRERTRKDSESKATSRESDRESGKSSRDQSASSLSKKAPDGRGKDEGKTVPKAAFKEPKLTVRESKMDGMSPKGGGAVTVGGGQLDTRIPSKRPSSAPEYPKLSTKKQKRIGSEGMKGPVSGSYSSSSPRITSTTPSTYPEKKTPKDKGHWAKMKPEVQEVKRQPESDESNSEDEASSKSEVRFGFSISRTWNWMYLNVGKLKDVVYLAVGSFQSI